MTMHSPRLACRGRYLRLGTVLWTLLVAVLVGACAPDAPAATRAAEDEGQDCSVLAAGFAAQAREAMDRFQELDAEAALSGGEELRAVIERMDALRAEFMALAPPECALPVKVSITRYMELTIDLHNAVWAADCPLCIEDIQTQATAARDRATQELRALEGAS